MEEEEIKIFIKICVLSNQIVCSELQKSVQIMRNQIKENNSDANGIYIEEWNFLRDLPGFTKFICCWERERRRRRLRHCNSKRLHQPHFIGPTDSVNRSLLKLFISSELPLLSLLLFKTKQKTNKKKRSNNGNSWALFAFP